MVSLILVALLLPVSLGVYKHDMGCRPELKDAFRYIVVNNINNYRQLLANGTAPNKCGYLPPAKHMYKIFYDCSLEDRAYAYAASCGKGKFPMNSMVNIYSNSAPFNEGRLHGLMMQRLNKDLALAVTHGVDSKATVQSNIGAWSQVQQAKHAKDIQYTAEARTRVGCAYYPSCNGTTKFPAKAYFVCVFDEPKPANGQRAYAVGSKCTKDSDCTLQLGSSCDAKTGLCEYFYKNSKTNDMCGSKSDALTDSERQIALNWHNNYRSSLARGLQNDGGAFAGKKAPGAAKMMKLRYNCTVEANARKWAENCVWAHSTKTDRPGMGENLFYSTDTVMEKHVALIDSAQGWWGELSKSGVGPNLTFINPPIDYQKVGHYTQMAWETTTAIGCAVAHCKTMSFSVCQYYPSGNWAGEQLYQVGNGCKSDAACGAGKKCIVSEGLCDFA